MRVRDLPLTLDKVLPKTAAVLGAPDVGGQAARTRARAALF